MGKLKTQVSIHLLNIMIWNRRHKSQDNSFNSGLIILMLYVDTCILLLIVILAIILREVEGHWFLSREHEGTERDTSSHFFFIICHSH